MVSTGLYIDSLVRFWLEIDSLGSTEQMGPNQLYSSTTVSAMQPKFFRIDPLI